MELWSANRNDACVVEGSGRTPRLGAPRPRLSKTRVPLQCKRSRSLTSRLVSRCSGSGGLSPFRPNTRVVAVILRCPPPACSRHSQLDGSPSRHPRQVLRGNLDKAARAGYVFVAPRGFSTSERRHQDGWSPRQGRTSTSPPPMFSQLAPSAIPRSKRGDTVESFFPRTPRAARDRLRYTTPSGGDSSEDIPALVKEVAATDGATPRSCQALEGGRVGQPTHSGLFDASRKRVRRRDDPPICRHGQGASSPAARHARRSTRSQTSGQLL